jgi:hypothetical protein
MRRVIPFTTVLGIIIIYLLPPTRVPFQPCSNTGHTEAVLSHKASIPVSPQPILAAAKTHTVKETPRILMIVLNTLLELITKIADHSLRHRINQK